MNDSRSTGFTLVELVMVLVILGILASVGAPRFFARGGFDERFFSDDVFSALRYAQKLAVASGCPVQVDFTATDYTLRQRAACQTGPFSAAVPHPGSNDPTYTATGPAGLLLASSVDPLIFDALGRALDATLAVSDATVSVGTRSFQVVGESGFVYDPTL